MNNPNCDGNGSDNCTPGEVKRYPTGGNSAVILCLHHWAAENKWRYEMATIDPETGLRRAQPRHADWPQENWFAVQPVQN